MREGRGPTEFSQQPGNHRETRLDFRFPNAMWLDHGEGVGLEDVGPVSNQLGLLGQAGDTCRKMAQKEALSSLAPDIRPGGIVCSGHCCHRAVAPECQRETEPARS